MALVKDRGSEECGSDEQWTMMMDRGGLWHIKETTYALLLSVEEEIRCLKNLNYSLTTIQVRNHQAGHWH